MLMLTSPSPLLIDLVGTTSISIHCCITYTLQCMIDGCRANYSIIPSNSPDRMDLDINITWPEANIGERVRVNCPCGDSSQEEGLQARRYCGGDFTNGAHWEVPDIEACRFSDIAREICRLNDVRMPYSSTVC